MTVPCDYFARLYAESADPWRFRERWYERRKRDLMLAALNRLRYASAFEPGCSVGELTAALATRCDTLLASDIDLDACRHARERVRAFSYVRVEQQVLPEQWPKGSFDLIVISELAYYFDEIELGILIGRTKEALVPGGTLLACHWRHPVDIHLQSANAVHALFARRLGLRRLVHHEEPDFLLDAWSDEERSVAQLEGLA